MANLQDRSTVGDARWRVRWQENRATPERSYTFRSARTSRGQSEAEKAARRLKAYVDLMGHHLDVIEALVGAGFRVSGVPSVKPDPETVTVAEYAERWLASLMKPNPRTRDDYRKMLDRHVLPMLGAIDIMTLTREHIALWLRAQETSTTGRGVGDAPRAPALHTIANRHGVLSALLADAAKDGLRTGNPAIGLGPTPKSMHREMCFLTHQEWATLHRCLHRPYLKVSEGSDDPAFGQDLATLLVGTGLRWSEATALTVGQCQLLTQRAVVRVDRAWKREADGSYLVAEPKSRRSVRSVDVPEQVRDVLIARTAGKTLDELVFLAPRGSSFLSAWFYDRFWKPALDRAADAGLAKRPRVHDLRHTHASWLIADSRPLASIQRRLGHESITTTIDRYGHLLPELDAGNAEAIERAFANLLREM
jgi:integrase